MKSNKIYIDGKNLTIGALSEFVKNKETKIGLNPRALAAARSSHNFLSKSIEVNNKIVYGINTGFGPMASYILPHHKLLELQNNLILSHAVGMGEKIPNEFVLSAMVVRLNTLLKGHSGVSPELLSLLERFINLRICPIIPEHGAVGTSGDLVQLAHIALALLGKGDVYFENKIQKTSAVFKRLKLKPYALKAKEGLALINGTSVMAGISAVVCADAKHLLSLAARNGALALELVNAYNDSFSEKLHQLRPHPGQLAIAKTLRKILADSKLIRNRDLLHKNANLGNEVNHIKESVQEVYSMRCVAQILGPVYDTLRNAWDATEIEMNSVTDNPIVDWQSKKFLHGGNFHGDYIAVNMDHLKAGLVKMTMLSERRLNFFLNNKINGIFPPFLNLDTPGLTLAFQALQFVATSTTANSQTLAYPMNLHSISTNGDNQDVVSMGTDAALMANKVANNAGIVLTIEALALCQAVDYLGAENLLSKESRQLYSFIRQYSKKITADREIHAELETVLRKVQAWPEMNIFDQFQNNSK